MGGIAIQSRTQRIVVASQQRIEVSNRVASVSNTTIGVSVESAGQQGPPGVQGIQGPPGIDADTQVEEVMYGHINDPTPHPVYDDMPDLTILLENGLI